MAKASTQRRKDAKIRQVSFAFLCALRAFALKSHVHAIAPSV
jgi:hypothetical protein